MSDSHDLLDALSPRASAVCSRVSPCSARYSASVMRDGSHVLNLSSSEPVHPTGDDSAIGSSHALNMAAPDHHGWYLQEWFAATNHVQNDLVLQLGFHKNTAHKLFHGLQPYRRDYVEQIASFLNIRPFELLMLPEDAMAVRRLREAVQAVASPGSEALPPPTQKEASRRRRVA